MDYSHTQRGWLHYLFLGLAGLFGFLAWYSRGEAEGVASMMLGTVAFFLIFFSLTFMTLTIEDEGNRLVARFGPVPLISKRIPYGDIEEAEKGRSRFIDGWGAHWVPRRGWTFNISGFACVRLKVRGKTIQLGTDDVDGLFQFLEEKIRSPN